MKHLVTFFWALLLMQMVNFVLNSLVRWGQLKCSESNYHGSIVHDFHSNFCCKDQTAERFITITI